MPEARSRTVHIGCSGWNYASWREEFYAGKPARLWLQHYAQSFDTVEVNNTFYRLPLKSSVARWVEETPPTFLLAVKASRYLTHVKRLTDLGAGIERYYERLEPLVRSPKLGPVLWQLPANFRRDDERLAAALAALPKGRHCFEFRHASWFVEPVYELLRLHGAGLVIGDRPEVKEFQAFEFTTDWTYVRFHYGSRGRRGNYSESELEDWARRFEEWRRELQIFAYFNNDWEGFAVRNALWLKRRLS
ncbi:MAG TPA: DUF72 domain-containing protein [Gaiellaceae bacterium]|nr:DUF72 domain-containing protein [Gaiellaceae bacterium]